MGIMQCDTWRDERRHKTYNIGNARYTGGEDNSYFPIKNNFKEEKLTKSPLSSPPKKHITVQQTIKHGLSVSTTDII